MAHVLLVSRDYPLQINLGTVVMICSLTPLSHMTPPPTLNTSMMTACDWELGKYGVLHVKLSLYILYVLLTYYNTSLHSTFVLSRILSQVYLSLKIKCTNFACLLLMQLFTWITIWTISKIELLERFFYPRWYGRYDLFSHSSLSYDPSTNTEYLHDNCLRLRVRKARVYSIWSYHSTWS